VGESGKTLLSPGDVVIVSGLNLGQSPTVKFAGETAYMINPPNGGNQMTVEIPVDIPLFTNNMIVTTGGGTSPPFPITVGQYAPALFPAGNGSPALPSHEGGAPVTLANPAAPGETVFVLAYGLGATAPIVPAGTPAPSNPPAATVAAPVVNLGGSQATGVSAALAPGQIGLYFVSFTVPLNQPTGGIPLSITLGGITTGLTTLQVFNGPIITNVSNAASNITAALPNAGIAQGSIFTIYGSGLGPANISLASAAFTNTALSGTSVAVTVAGTTVNALMYYTSAGQVAALLPSNTPTGTGTIAITYNGTTGPASPITVVTSNVGVFTLDQTGSGPGIVTFPDYTLVSAAKDVTCGVPITPCGAANPGDVLTIWATGVGPVKADDASTLGQDLANVPVTIWLGGVSITPIFRGRGCCIGEDQIAFAVPNNVPTGCAVPLAVQIDNQISNFTVLPVANGSRNCTPSNPAEGNFEASILAGPITFGSITLRHQGTGGTPPAFADDAKFQFLKITSYPAGTQPFFASWIDDHPAGTCTVVNNLGGPGGPPLSNSNLAPVDAGLNFIIKGPNGSVQVKAGPGQSDPTLSAAGTFLLPGNFTVSGGGGVDIGPINASITFPSMPALTSPSNAGAATRSSGLPVTWTGGSGNVQMIVSGATDNRFTIGAQAACTAPASLGSFTIPPYVLLPLPPGPNGGVTLGPADTSVGFTANGLTAGFLQTHSDGAGFGYGAGTGNFTLQ
jgi:uncharacterized protein (TIGR03437 family)